MPQVVKAGGTGLSTAGTNGTLLQSNGTTFVNTTATYPGTAGTSGKVLISDGTNIVSSTPTFPNASATSGKFIQSDGTNWIASTPTLPTTAGTTGTILRSNGTNFVNTTATYPTTTTINQVLYSSAANTISGLATANSAVLATNASGVPSITATPTITSVTFGSGTALDTFVEGTFSPSLLGSTGGSGQTYFRRYGYYQKINNRVYIIIGLVTNSKGTLSGNIQIGNLPYTIANTPTSLKVSINTENVTFTAGYTWPGLELITNTTTCNLLQFGSAQDAAYITMANLSSGNGRFFGSFSYTTVV